VSEVELRAEFYLLAHTLIPCLESVVHDYLHRGDTVLAEVVEEELRKLKRLLPSA